MRAIFLLLVLTVVATIAASSAAQTSRRQTLLFDAVFTQARTEGPPANKVGHLQIAGGPLRDAAGRDVGRFAVTCRWVESIGQDDARERCSGSVQSKEGRLRFGGDARQSNITQTWAVDGVSGAYRGARGSLVVRDIGVEGREAITVATLAPRSGVTLRVGVVARPRANATFVARVNAACTSTREALSKLPPFPYQDFDPLHPDAKLLPKVGAFFNGPGNPRPALHALQRRLVAFGSPPANRDAWTNVLHSFAAKIADGERQFRAAVAASVPRWLSATKAALAGERRLLIDDAVFGSDSCAF